MSSRLSRRGLLGAASLLTLGLAAGLPPRAARAEDKVLRIGVQKYGSLVLLKGKGSLDAALAPLGFKVTWTEFPAGPQLLEALNVGVVDFGTTGEAPPIFAQAAGAPLLYVGHEPPAPRGEAIIVPKDSTIATIADLKGKRVALNKGSNVHYLLVKALAAAGVDYKDITPVFLPPADARAAFEKGAVDAWAIWDPFLAAAQAATGARTLVDGTGLVANHQFYLAEQKFAAANPQVIDIVLKGLHDIGEEVKADPAAAAKLLTASVGIPAPILTEAISRQAFGVKALSPEVIAEQQRIADTFFGLGLIPKAISIADVVRKVAS
ncbi:MAG: sulfonate ABC transporter substrate-binding protein [Zavarzinia sp.]|nr:sulfonate ABC transporter substrate-binding protein [Zavarzinia sp.]